MRVLSAAALAMLAVTAVHSQQPDFGGVSVLVTVLDRAGKPVRDLQQRDFTLLDEGKPQDILFFRSVAQPFTFVVLIDVSASMARQLGLAWAAALHFLDNMAAEDQAQIGTFNDTIAFNARFTKDRNVLDRALAKMSAIGGSRLYDALDESLDRLASVGGYKAIVVFSDGMDTRSRRRSTDVLMKARNQGVLVYTIGVQRDSVRVSQSAPIRQPEQKRELQRLADETGGGYAELTNSRESALSALAQVAQEIHSVYVIGFMPTQRDGKNRKLQIRTTPGSSVRARRGYAAPRD